MLEVYWTNNLKYNQRMQQHCKSLTSYGFVDSFVEIQRPNRNVFELTLGP